MAKKAKPADEAVTDTEQAAEAVEAEAPPAREASAVEVAEALRRFSWHDDSHKVKMAEALTRTFVITARPEVAE